MYQDLSFMKIPLPEDVLKLKNYGDYAGAQKMIRYFLEHKEIPKALRKRLEIEQEIIGVMGADEYPYTYAEALEMMTSHLRDFKEEELQYLKEIGAADWIYIDGEVVDFDVPVDMLYFDEDIERIVEQYLPEWDTDNCENAVLKIFNIYCKKYYTNKKINFFDDKSLLMVIRTSQYRNKWKEKFNNYRIAKENFLQIKCVERYYLI